MVHRIPQHIAIIMDGNGRWAQQRGLPKIAGHQAGAKATEEAIKSCLELGVKILSLYTFSTENWRRPTKEVKALMHLLEEYLKSRLADLQKNKIRLLISGEMSSLAKSLKSKLQRAITETKDNSKLILNLALNYGGREEILQATKAIAVKVKQEKLPAHKIDQQLFANHLYTRGLPDPDLLIRTSGEQRISNFFLWQLSYAEFYFTTRLWPDFKKQDLLQAIEAYRKRERRFGT